VRVTVESRPITRGDKSITRWTDGTHVYWKDGLRVRWALIDYHEGGPSFRTHGAQATLEDAVQDAWHIQRQREGSS
jgi:hypothetical protein